MRYAARRLMWARALEVVLGLWLMVSPGLLDYAEPVPTHHYIVGPLVITAAIIAMAGATRPLRWVNVAIGVWMLPAPWLLGFEGAARWTSMLVGVLLVALGLVRGTVNASYGGGWRMLWNGDDAADTRDATERAPR